VERIGRHNDDFREKLSRADIVRVCESHGIRPPGKIVPERRGNEVVAYHLDDTVFLSFGISDCTQRKVEVLNILQHVETIPTPRVLGWSEQDPHLQVPYMIVERCPGSRLDTLWKQCSPDEQLQLLGALGRDMGWYHTTTLQDVQAAARTAGIDQWVSDEEDARVRRSRAFRQEAQGALETLCERLNRWEIDGTSLAALLEGHYASDLPAPGIPFVGPGLIHTEPAAEHFLVEKTDNDFRLSGCVDLEECAIADSADEIAGMYASMLALDDKCLSAFREGYEQFFPFPSDAEERLRIAAVDHDLWATLWLLDTMEKRPEWAFAAFWLAGHVKRLEGWLDERKRVRNALFREDIGPW
jgi:hypothetical protein